MLSDLFSDTLAMAGMSLQCLKEAATQVKNKEELDQALATIKQKIMDSQRADGHLGNEFSTGLAVQVRLGMIQIDQTSAHLGSGKIFLPKKYEFKICKSQ